MEENKAGDKQGGNGGISPIPNLRESVSLDSQDKKIMLVSFDYKEWMDFLSGKLAKMPDVNVTCDFLYNKILCYGLLECAREAIFVWNMQQSAPKEPLKHGILNFVRKSK